MVSQEFKRRALVTQTDYTAQVAIGFNSSSASAFYIPVRYSNFKIPDSTITGATTVSASGVITGTVGSFDALKVGDRLIDVSVGALGTAITVDRDCNQILGTNKLIYESSFTSSTLGVKAGDVASGTDIPVGAFVEYIDYAERTIYLSESIDTLTDETAPIDTITFTAPVRVTAVRTSTAATNPNQIEVTPAIATGGTDVTLTIEHGATEAVFSVIRLVPLDSTSTQARMSIDVAYLPGTAVKPSDNGLNGITPTTYNYSNVGTLQFDADRFLLDAGLPRE